MANTGSTRPTGPFHPKESGYVVVGKIIRPWGLQGDLKVEVLTDVPSRFSPGSVLHLDGHCVRVQRSRPVRGGMLVRLDTVDDRPQAESLRGRLLCVLWQEVEPAPQGAYYHFQIIDIDVWSNEGEYLGRVAEILPTGANDVYVVRREGRPDLLLPAIRDVVLEVDPESGRMTVCVPEGLG